MSEALKPIVEQIPSRDSDISAVGSANAPVVFADVAAAYGLLDGVGRISLIMMRQMPVAGQALPGVDQIVTAHLRMGMNAVLSLRNACDGILAMAAPVPKEELN